ncbi:hypothetical protein [Asaia sp. VD9]|uniref:hypothetical protein n=1 Tax=Asaia sp. VD9 TaxID=3081235 RepID=UPI003019BE55
MSLDIMDYSRLGDINRGIQRLTRTVQAQGSGATVPVETYNQLFASYEQARAQLAAVQNELKEWKEYGVERAEAATRFRENKDEWVVYAREQRARAEAAEAELDRLRAHYESSVEVAD